MSSYSGGRIQAIDALRGLCVVLMCCHHFLYDLAAFLGAPWWIFTNPVLDVLHYFFAGCFILLSGVSSRSPGPICAGAGSSCSSPWPSPP